MAKRPKSDESRVSSVEKTPSCHTPPATRHILWIAIFIFCASAVLLFARLGHYALWDDEASTALTAQGVLRTGDTTAVIGKNVVAFRNGLTLRGLKDRAQPPLPAYLTAAAMLVAGENAFGARVAFALCGLATVGLILWWMWRDCAQMKSWLLMGLGLLGNVSFFLYCRQSRYYGLVILLSVSMAYLYLHWQKRWHLALLGFLSFLLFATHYMIFAAVWACLAVDFLFWGRKRQPLKMKDWLVLFLPQMVIGSIVLLIWNPFQTTVGDQLTSNSLAERLKLLWWNLRELNRAELGCGLLLLLAPFVARKSSWMLRGIIAILVYALVMVAVSVQPVKITYNADIRYLVPLIPLCIAIVAIGLAQIKSPLWLALIIGVIAFETNLFHLGFLTETGFRSTLLKYISELRTPLLEPYTPVIEWVKQNVPNGKSVWVTPDWMTYPLMFHAPHVTYAWQLYPLEKWKDDSARNPKIAAVFEQFKNLPPIHFKKEAPPDYIILFGPRGVDEMLKVLNSWKTLLRYEPFKQLDYFWQDRYRPELFWHHFTPRTDYDKDTEAIYLMKLTGTNAIPMKTTP